MPKLIIFSCILLLFQQVSAQKHDPSQVSQKIEKWVQLSNEAHTKGDHTAYKIYIDSILVVAQEYERLNDEIRALTSLGIYYNNTHAYDAALSYYHRALEKLKEYPDDPSAKAVVLSNLANLYNNIGEYKKAKEAFEEVLGIAEKYNAPKNVKIATLTGLVKIYISQKDYIKAIEYEQRVKLMATAIRDTSAEITSLNNLAASYAHLQAYDTSLQYAKKALQRYNNNIPTAKKAWALFHVGRATNGLQEYDKAVLYLEQSRDLATYQDDLELKMYTHQHLAVVYEQQKKFQQAIQAHKSYILNKEEYLKNLSGAKRLEVMNELAETDKVISLQSHTEASLFKEKLVLIVGTVLLLSLLILTLVFYLKKRKQIQAQTVQLEKDKALLADENKTFTHKNARNSCAKFNG